MADQYRGRGRGRGYGGGSGGGGRDGSGQGHSQPLRPLQGGGGRGGESHNGGWSKGMSQGGRGGNTGRSGSNHLQAVLGNGCAPQPDENVTRLEDLALQEDVTSSLSRLSLDCALPRRPDYGKHGTPIVLWANYFKLEVNDVDMTLYRYSVSFPSEADLNKKKGLRKKLIKLLLNCPPFSNVRVASDGATLLISPRKISLNGESQDITLQLDEKKTCAAVVTYLGAVSFDGFFKSNHSSSIGRLPNEEPPYGIQSLNIIVADGPASDTSDTNTIAFPGNRFFSFGNGAKSHSIGAGIQAYRGYSTSVRSGVNRLLLNINVSTSAFYKPGNLLGLMREVRDHSENSHLNSHTSIAKFVRKLRITKTYGTSQARVHTIQDVSPYGENSATLFFLSSENQGKISVKQLFANKYNTDLQSPMAPCVNIGHGDKKIWIPVECCQVVPGQLAKRHLSGKENTNMLDFAVCPPVQNALSIIGSGLDIVKLEKLGAFGIQVERRLLTVPGRVLQTPSLEYRTKNFRPRNGVWNLLEKEAGREPLCKPMPLGSWSCLVVSYGRQTPDNGTIAFALNAFKQVMNRYALAPDGVPKIVHITINPDPQTQTSTQIRNQIHQVLSNEQAFPSPPKFLLVILPNDNAVIYDSIKYVCDIKLGISNVCSIRHKFIKSNADIFINIILKINQKLGGLNHYIESSNLSPLDSDTIVFGIDVTHPSRGSSKSAPSIAGVVASKDRYFSQYPASIRVQAGREEMVQALQEMVVERLRLWQKNNGFHLPKKIIVYRDGVSESQYHEVLKVEYDAFLNAVTQLYPAKATKPKISIIVVGKRHHTRFYPTKQEHCSKHGNPQPGTVVDRGVTDGRLFDFYLLAHQGIKGTSRPAHYVVIKDDNHLGADQLQQLTYNLCYTFARATRAVSICSPAYYADILCERGRSYLQDVLKGNVEYDQVKHGSGSLVVHERVRDSMFYI